MLLSLNPELQSSEVREIMMQTANKIDMENGDYDANGHSPLYGHGRINAHRAVALVAGDGDERLPQMLELEHRVSHSIPDHGEVDDVIAVPLDVIPKRIEVSLALRYSRLADLRMTLTPADSEELVLADHLTGSESTYSYTYRSTDSPELFANTLEATAKGD